MKKTKKIKFLDNLNKITLLTTCMNRNTYLKKALKSWIKLKFKEIIIIDWNSRIPVFKEIKEIQKEYNIKIVRINSRKFFNGGTARNTGARLCSSKYIFFIDSDIKLNFDKIKKINLEYNSFYHGHWKVTGLSTTGTFIIPKYIFRNINGFNENMKSWGYEDEELYNRIKNENVNTCTFESGTLIHIKHSDEERIRFRNKKGELKMEGLKINKNKKWLKYNRQEKIIGTIYYSDGTIDKNIII